MPLNDDVGDEYDAHLEDEDAALWPIPAIEIGLALAPDLGPGSFAEDGRIEIMEEDVMHDGEESVLGSAAMYGQSEIGDDDVGGLASEEGASELGGDEIGGLFSEEGASEIGNLAAPEGPSEIGGLYPEEGASEIGGLYPEEGQSEIGADDDVQAPFESFMLGPTRMGGLAAEDGASEIGNLAAPDGPSEIGAQRAAVAKVVERARDARTPPPLMRAVEPEAPELDDDDFGLTDMLVEVGAAAGRDVFPLTTQLLARAGAGMAPRYVRIDTEASYKAFRAEHSPELAELSDRVAELDARLARHEADPDAHARVADDIDELTLVGAEVMKAEDDKRIDMWMPRRFDGLVTAWREGDFVCASLTLPGQDGEVRICTSLEPVRRCVDEICRHAAESGVPARTVVGVLPAMGCVLGAGTVMKEIAAAAPAILQRPEAARPAPFVVRIEPAQNPAISALASLALACRMGVAQACAEWKGLAELSPPAVRQAMTEAIALAKAKAA